jgi:AcrR family transcriptional regulator
VARGKDSSTRLTKADWVGAALEAVRTGGLAAVTVEPLAVRLHATKGSFYWHFRDRQELVAAVLARWEQEETEQVIAGLSAAPDPAGRLRLLVETTIGQGRRTDLSVSLLADADDPLVAAALGRVTNRRLEYLAQQFEALGSGHDEARARALLAYTAFLGQSQLRRWLPTATGSGDLRTFASALERALLGDLLP